jgi:hypothetical protein
MKKNAGYFIEQKSFFMLYDTPKFIELILVG